MKQLSKILFMVLIFCAKNIYSQEGDPKFTNILLYANNKIKFIEDDNRVIEKCFYDFVKKGQTNATTFQYWFNKSQNYNITAFIRDYEIPISIEIKSNSISGLETKASLKVNGKQAELNFKPEKDGYFTICVNLNLSDLEVDFASFGLIIDRAEVYKTKYSSLLMQQKFSTIVNSDKISDNILVRRCESGLFIEKSNHIVGESYTTLRQGGTYLIVALSDSKVSEFNVSIYNSEGDKVDTSLYAVVNQDTIEDKQLGSMKKIIFIPDKTDDYRIQILAYCCLGSRYSFITLKILKEEQSKTDDKKQNNNPLPAVTYYLDKKTTCEYDAKTVEARNCNEPTFANDSIQVNEEQESIKINFNKYQILSTDQASDGNSKVYKLSNDNNEKAFLVVNDKERFIQFIKLNTYQLLSYHVNSFK